MNIIITCPRRFEREAGTEAAQMLERAGLQPPSIQLTDMPGILVLQTSSDPVEAVAAMARAIDDEPWTARYVQRAIPVQESVPSRISDIVEAATRLSVAIQGTYRVTVEKRHTALSAREIISRIADTLSGKVSLENPDYVVLVEILGADAGVSVIKPRDILRTAHAKLSGQDC